MKKLIINKDLLIQTSPKQIIMTLNKKYVIWKLTLLFLIILNRCFCIAKNNPLKRELNNKLQLPLEVNILGTLVYNLYA